MTDYLIEYQKNKTIDICKRICLIVDLGFSYGTMMLYLIKKNAEIKRL